MNKNAVKKLLTVFLTLALLCGALPGLPGGLHTARAADIWDGSSDTDFAGSGTEPAPYLITSAAELAGLASNVKNIANYSSGKYFELTTDINLNGRAWTPIGYGTYTDTTYSKNFKGHFIGNNHTVANMAIGSSGSPDVSQYAGLFGYVYGATITGVKVSGAIYSDYPTSRPPAYIGGLIACSDLLTTVSGCTSAVNITGNIAGNSSRQSDVGGLVGHNRFTLTIADSCSTGTIIIGSDNSFTGGLLGYNSGDCTITGSHATGSITAGRYTGGLIGYIYGNTNITDSYASGSVASSLTTAAPSVGGLIGYINARSLYTFNITGCYATGDVTCSSPNANAGGIIGYTYRGYPIAITGCYATGAVTCSGSNANSGGLIGSNAGAGGDNCAITRCYATGAVTGSGTGANVGGLIGYSSYNCSISGSYATGSVSGGDGSCAGGLMGKWLYRNETLTNSYASGTVMGGAAGASYTGGFIGYAAGANNFTGSIANSYASGAVTGGTSGTSYTGGFIGYAAAGNNATCAITNSYTAGAATGTSGQTGGFTGYNNGAFTNCYYNSTANSSDMATTTTGETSTYMNSYDFADILNSKREALNDSALKPWVMRSSPALPVLCGVGESLSLYITAQPSGISVEQGDFSKSLTVAASCNGALSYQWYGNLTGSYDGSSINGATSAGYPIPSSVIGTVYNYCVVTAVYENVSTSVISRIAAVNVVDTTPPNLSAGSVSRTSDSAIVKFTSHEAGTYYYDTVSSQSEPVIDTSHGGAACDTTEQTILLTGLTAGQQYIYIKVKDAYGNVSSALEIDIPAYDVHAPSAPAAPTSVTAVAGINCATVSFTAPADNGGSTITGYIVTSSPGGSTASGTASPIIVSGLTAGISYTFTVQAVNAVGNGAVSVASDAVTPKSSSSSDSSSSSSSSSSSTATTTTVAGSGSVNIQVNGKNESAGTVTNFTEGTTITTTVRVDQVKLTAKLQQEEPKAVVTIPLDSKTDKLIAELNGQMVKDMESKEAIVQIKTEHASYTLPAQQINIGSVSEQIGTQVALSDIKVCVEISKADTNTVKVVENAAKQGEFMLVTSPVEFNVTCTYGDKTVNVTTFNSFVERTIAIPDGIDPGKVTTAVVTDADGTVRHVPTQVIQIEDKYYARVNSLTNSTYSLIYHPVEFQDTTGHWAQTAVNDMGSRLVISGTGHGCFSPNKTISRAEFVAVMVKALGLQPGQGSKTFSDIADSAWYNGYVKTACQYGIIQGYGNGIFAPNDEITREQAAAMITRAMDVTKLKPSLSNSEIQQLLTGFGDIDQAGSWAKSSIAACVKAGIISGIGKGRVAPKASVTRAEVAVMVRGLLHKSGLI